MELRARLSTVTGKAATSADQPNKVSMKLEPMYVTEDDAAWLFEHLGQFLSIRLDRSPPPRSPLEEAIAANGTR